MGGPYVVASFLQKQDLDLLGCAHQVAEDDYEFLGKRQMITLYSTPSYCGEHDNARAIVTIDESLMRNVPCRHTQLNLISKPKAPRSETVSSMPYMNSGNSS